MKIWHFSHIMSGCRIGDGCNIGQNVVVSPDVVLGKNVKVQNNVSIRWTVREVTVVVQDAQVAGDPEVLRITTAFDRGP